MARPRRDPGPSGCEGQRPFRVAVVTEGARDGDEAVPGDPRAGRPGLRRGRPGDGEEGDAAGERHGDPHVPVPGEAVVPRPVVVEDVPVAQVGDAGAPDLPEGSAGAPWCGVPRKTTARTRAGHACPARDAAASALRTTRPPMLCATIETSAGGTRASRTNASRSSASERPFSETCRPVL